MYFKKQRGLKSIEMRHSEFLPAGRQGISESHHTDKPIVMRT
jgi:hypothetical protein